MPEEQDRALEMHKQIDKDIFNTLVQKEDINFLTQCRRVTEGIVEILVIEKGITRPDGSSYMLGDIMADSNLLTKLGIDINIRSHINYIRLYGNRAAHYRSYKILPDEVNYVKGSLRELVRFFYNSIGKDVPKNIKSLLDKTGKSAGADKLFEYRTDFSLFSQALLSLETSSYDYPNQGKTLLANICSKIILDAFGHIPRNLYVTDKPKLLNIQKAINFIARKKLIDENILSKLSAINEFIFNSSKLRHHNKEVPEVPEDIKTAVKDVTDWFFFNRYTKHPDNDIRAIPFFTDLFTLFMAIASIITAVYGYVQQPSLNNPVIYPVFVSVFITGAFIYAIAFSYNLFYSALPSIRNKALYSITKKISTYGSFTTIGFLYFVYMHILNDLKRDTAYLPFFIVTIIWSVSLLVSNVVNNNAKTRHDKLMRILSVIAFGFVLFMINYIRSRYNI